MSVKAAGGYTKELAEELESGGPRNIKQRAAAVAWVVRHAERSQSAPPGERVRRIRMMCIQ